MGAHRLAFAAALVGALGLSGCMTHEPDPGMADFETGETGGSTGLPVVDAADVPRSDRLDLGTDEAPEGESCAGGISEEAFSYIWISNSVEGTVSKIETNTGAEVGRYFTGPTMGIDDPSRTTVGLSGDVAVANRLGSVVTLAADQERCVDRNGNGMIDTSSGATDVLPWGEDECVGWHRFLSTDADRTHGPRPVGWDTGAGKDPCDTSDDRVWVGWFSYHNNTGRFERRAGSDGALLDEVAVEDWDDSQTNAFGPYGGAVDGDGNFWVLGLFGPLVKIDGDTLAVERWEVPADTSPYGMALDEDGHPWLAGYNGNILHLDPKTGFDEPMPVGEGSRLRGLQIDQDGQAWVAVNEPCGLAMVDTKSRRVVYDHVELTDCIEPVGVSVDVEGQVWIPDFGANAAFRFNPDDLTSVRTLGLNGPYTYSDMTGAGLRLVVHQPVG